MGDNGWKRSTVHITDIGGPAEVRAAGGGVTRTTLQRWTETKGFPAPIRQLEQGPVWDLKAVRKWLETTGRLV